MEGMHQVSASMDRGSTIVGAIDRELDHYESLIPMLSDRAGPFLNIGEDSEARGATPEPAPVNELQRLANRLAHLNRSMHALILRIDQ